MPPVPGQAIEPGLNTGLGLPFSIGTLPVGPPKINSTRIEFGRSEHTYVIQFSARNGVWNEVLKIKWKEGKWHQTIDVQWPNEKNRKPWSTTK